jgi:twitching motility protein PilT
MLKRRASDLHLRVGIKPTLRIDGKLTPMESEPVAKEAMTEILSQILSPEQMQRFSSRNEMDLALSVPDLGRFRINLLRRGLIILTGTTGSGKSTSLAAMIEHINSGRAENILTIEDPIEFMYTDKESIISQREVGSDSQSFANALRHAFRQDPDVILIGEIRDTETMGIAMQAADTGPLVLTTLHTLNAVETISRIISFFPPHQHQQIRLLLAGTLKAIVCQRLLPRCDTVGRVPAVEILTSTGAIRDAISDPMKTNMILELIQSGNIQYGMQSFDQSIMGLYRQGWIDYETAMSNATNPDDFDLRVKGITSSSDATWQDAAATTMDDPV